MYKYTNIYCIGIYMSIILLCILIVCCCVIAWPYQLVAGKMPPSVDITLSVQASMVC